MLLLIFRLQFQDWSPCYSADGILHPNELQPQQIFCNDQGIWEMLVLFFSINNKNVWYLAVHQDH